MVSLIEVKTCFLLDQKPYDGCAFPYSWHYVQIRQQSTEVKIYNERSLNTSTSIGISNKLKPLIKE